MKPDEAHSVGFVRRSTISHGVSNSSAPAPTIVTPTTRPLRITTLQKLSHSQTARSLLQDRLLQTSTAALTARASASALPARLGELEINVSHAPQMSSRLGSASSANEVSLVRVGTSLAQQRDKAEVAVVLPRTL